MRLTVPRTFNPRESTRYGYSKEVYLLTSKAGEASGDTSVEMVNVPTNFRSSDGAVTDAGGGSADKNPQSLIRANTSMIF